MSDDYSWKARIDVEVTNVSRAIGDVGALSDKMEQLIGVGNKVVEELVDIGDSVRKLGSSTRQGKKELETYADGFKELVVQLNSFKKAHKEATQLGVVGGSTDGKGMADMQNMSTEALRKLIAVDDARGVNAVSVAREIVRQREREAAAAEKAAQQSIDAINKEHAAFVKAYTEKHNLMLQEEAAQKERRFATTQLGSGYGSDKRQTPFMSSTRNVGTVRDYNLAQDEYKAQELKDMGDYYRQLEKDTKAYADANEKAGISPPTLRYALYDIAAALNQVSDATLGVVAAAVKVASEYETAFTDVERTVSTNINMVELLDAQLLQLANTIPLTYAEITKIASLGGQLGVAAGDIAGFTKTVAQFSSLSGVSVEESAKAFGTISELLDVSVNEFNNLGSAIAYVGVNSVATEAEIISVSNQISGVGASVGLTADYVVGLSGTLASLKVPAEQSRGALTKVFQQINRAVADGGEAMTGFASVLGVSTAEAENLASTNMEQFFTMFVNGLSGLDAQSLTATLDDLGLSELRVTNTLSKLATNTELMNDLMDKSTEAYDNGAVLAALYGYRVEDLASRIAVLQNAWGELTNTFGSAGLDFLKPMVDAVTEVINSLNTLAKSDVGQVMIVVTTAVLALAGALASMGVVAAVSLASMLALRTAVEGMGWTAASGGARALAAQLVGIGGGSRMAAAGLLGLRGALLATGIGVAIVAVGELINMFGKMAETSQDVFNKMVSDTSGLGEALGADLAARSQAIASGNQEAINSFVKVDSTVIKSADGFLEHKKAVSDAANVMGVDIPNAFNNATDSVTGQTRYIGDNTRAWIKNKLVASEAFQEMMKGAEGLNVGNESFATYADEIGLNMDELTNIVSSKGAAAGQAYVESLAAAAATNGKEGLDVANITLGLQTGLDSWFSWIGYKGQEFGADVNDIIQTIEGLNYAASIIDIPAADVPWVKETVADFGELEDSAGGAAAELRTLVTYAGELRGVFSRAFDLRWKALYAEDDLIQSWEDLSTRVDEARNNILGLSATRDKLEYFLSIAVAAGDTLRINDLTAQLAEANAEVATATSDASMELKGNSKAARQNRRTLGDLVNSNAEYLASLAESGMSQADLRKEALRLRREFVDQAVQMGYNRSEVEDFADSFGDMATIIKTIPRNVDIEFNGSAALTAIEEFVAEANSALGGVGGGNAADKASKNLQAIYDSMVATFNKNPDLILRIQAAANVEELRGVLRAAAKWADQQSILYLGRGDMAQYRYYSTQAADSRRFLSQLAGYATGGFTGRGGKYEPAGVVHRGEYVLPKSAVNQSTGLPYADALGRLQRGSAPAAGYANGGFANTSGMMVSLSPEDRQLLRNVGASGDIVVAVDSREIARANAKGSRLVTSEGGYL